MLTFESGGVIAWAANAAIVLLALGGVFAFIRLVKGPSFPDRVVVLDFLSIIVVAFTALFSIITGFSAYLDVSVAFALVAFLGTVAFARFAERRQHNGNNSDDTCTQDTQGNEETKP